MSRRDFCCRCGAKLEHRGFSSRGDDGLLWAPCCPVQVCNDTFREALLADKGAMAALNRVADTVAARRKATAA